MQVLSVLKVREFFLRRRRWHYGARYRPAAAYLTFAKRYIFGMHVPLFSAQALIPMALGAAHSNAAASDFLFLAAAGHQGLLPLLHEPREWPIKVWVQFLPQQTGQVHATSVC